VELRGLVANQDCGPSSVRIGIVGKYVATIDAHLSVAEALRQFAIRGNAHT
jgi:CTP synthase (UTP-ammonia lyase)